MFVLIAAEVALAGGRAPDEAQARAAALRARASGSRARWSRRGLPHVPASLALQDADRGVAQRSAFLADLAGAALWTNRSRRKHLEHNLGKTKIRAVEISHFPS